jgi:hypothetical protein
MKNCCCFQRKIGWEKMREARGGEKVSSGEIVEGNGGKRIIRCEEFPEAVGGGRDKIHR